MSTLRFDGRVAVVTGAGAGLGKSYALLLGSRGAKVVVNDLGGDEHGAGKSSRPADIVVEEIKQNGGIAVADYNSVVEGEKIIKTALDNFGRIDILINNAGILRDRSFPRISNHDWDIIQDVHLKGSFKTTQAAFPLFKKQGYGRIIMTSSPSGLYGNFGQANYAAAKMAVIGLSNTLAIEGAKYNIHCNAIVPVAATRLTQELIDKKMFEQAGPEYIAPIVAYLCHETCKDSGELIEVTSVWAKKTQFVRAQGGNLRKKLTDHVSIETVQQNWHDVTNMANAQSTILGFNLSQELLTTLQQLEAPATYLVPPSTYEFDHSNIISYALGVGASLERQRETKFLYEAHGQFQAIPTFFLLPTYTLLTFKTLNVILGKEVSVANMLHGEQYLEVFGELPRKGQLTSTFEVLEVLDKGNVCVVTLNVNSYYKSKLIIYNQITFLIRGHGNFGGQRKGGLTKQCIPKPTHRPDMSVSYKTTVDQAALYRLTGDYNPLHIDTAICKKIGFEKPILHGLCTLGISVRIILGAFADYDSSLFKSVKARFSKPVIPGQTLRVDMWAVNNRIHFETVVVETNTVVISGAYLDLKAIKMNSNM